MDYRFGTKKKWFPDLMAILLLLFIVLYPPSSWGDIITEDVEPLPDFVAMNIVKVRKSNFFNYMIPLIQKENQRLTLLRQRAQTLQKNMSESIPLTEKEKRWLTKISKQYKMTPKGDHFFKPLLERIDIVPLSMALAQAANESGWGTSRFAQQGNSLFGEWCYIPNCGIIPLKRDPGAHHEVASFATVAHSIRSYMHNLNTGSYFKEFRVVRATQRSQNKKPKGLELLPTLHPYSSLGTDYVSRIRSIVQYNKLTLYD